MKVCKEQNSGTQSDKTCARQENRSFYGKNDDVSRGEEGSMKKTRYEMNDCKWGYRIDAHTYCISI